jgi:hypothetical protein
VVFVHATDPAKSQRFDDTAKIGAQLPHIPATLWLLLQLTNTSCSRGRGQTRGAAATVEGVLVRGLRTGRRCWIGDTGETWTETGRRRACWGMRRRMLDGECGEGSWGIPVHCDWGWVVACVGGVGRRRGPIWGRPAARADLGRPAARVDFGSGGGGRFWGWLGLAAEAWLRMRVESG